MMKNYLVFQIKNLEAANFTFGFLQRVNRNGNSFAIKFSSCVFGKSGKIEASDVNIFSVKIRLRLVLSQEKVNTSKALDSSSKKISLLSPVLEVISVLVRQSLIASDNLPKAEN